MKKRIFPALLAALLLLGVLTACGSNPNLGTYKMSSILGMSVEDYAELAGMTKEEAAEAFRLELKSGGKAVFTIDNEAMEVKWKIDGEDITLYSDVDDETIEGTLVDGVMTLDFEGMEVVLTKEG